MDGGGLAWVIIDVIAVVVLAVAIIWGTLQWNRARKDPNLKRARDEATRENYKHGG